MYEDLPKLDIPLDFVVGDDIDHNILGLYGHFPCKIKSAVFVLFKAGYARASINLKEYELGPGDLITLIPDAFIQIHELRGDVGLSFAGFSSHFMKSVELLNLNFGFMPTVIENPVVRPSDGGYKFLDDYFTFLVKAFYNQGMPISSESHKAIYDIFLQQIKIIYQSDYEWEVGPSRREKEIYMEFIRVLRENYAAEHSVSFYVTKLGITLQHFCTMIKKASGVTASEIINKIIIMDAKTQLRSTMIPVKQVALSLGFNNTSFFYKFFKQHVGVTPQEYREGNELL